MLETRSVSKHFGGVAAVDAVSLKVHAGEIAGLIGPNGAGKTTMFNLLAGSLKPSAGEVLLNGPRIDDCSPPITGSSSAWGAPSRSRACSGR